MASDDNSGLAVGALRSFTVAEGILLLVLGVLALIFPMIASAWVTVVVALAFLVGGIIGWVNSLNRSRHCLLYTSPSPRDRTRSRMPSSA